MNSHRTAIARKSLPAPVRWLLNTGLIHGQVLDFGCGKCKTINDTLLKSPQILGVDSYDPHYEPNGLRWNNEGWYNVILCTYVLCTLPVTEEMTILKKIRSLLKKNGVAYITVRNDEPKQGWGVSSTGTFQRKVEIPYLFEIRKTSQYTIYLLTSDSKLK